MICFICNCEIENNNYRKLSGHIRKYHKNINLKEYYDTYLKKTNNEGVCERENCTNLCNFINLKLGYSKHCSYYCSSKDKKVLNKSKQTNLEKFGVEHPSRNVNIQNKRKQTNLRKYGVDHPSKNIDVQNKMKQTFFKKYGVYNPSQNVDIKNKRKQTYLKKYGVDHPSKNIDVQNKMKQTFFKKYGVKNIFDNKEVLNKTKQTKRKKYFNKLLNSDRLKNKCIPNFNINEYDNTLLSYSWICSKCNHIFEDDLDNGKIPRCPICYPVLTGYSKMEKELVEFVKSLDIKIIENSKKIIPPYELDIYIPSHNLAIEFNGLYWHSEINGNKDRNYHLNKSKLCKEKGIQLIHIFEDEWNNKCEIIKSIIKSKLNILKKIHARKCNIKKINNIEANNFLFDNHLQGCINSYINLGLYYKNELVSILTLGKPRYTNKYEWEILRFCSKLNIIVVGGLSKLFNCFVKNYNPNSIVTYADLRYGTGKSYEKIGFIEMGKTPPSYYYLKISNIHRFNRIKFQKHKLSKLLENFDSNLTEWQNMQLNGYDRIWDCGNTIFVK